MENNEDPVAFLRQMADDVTQLHGAADPQAVALQDASAYYSRISSVLDVLQDEVDLYMLARSEIEAGFDPRAALRNVANGASGADAARQAENVLDWLDGYFAWFDFLDGSFGTATDNVEDVVDVRRVGVDDIPPPSTIDPLSLGLDPPPAPDAADLGLTPGTMDLLAPGPGDEVRQILDPTPQDLSGGIGDGLRLDGDGAPPPATFEPGAPGVPLVQTRFDETGAGWLDDAGDTVDGVRGDYQDMAPGGAGRTADDGEDIRAVVDGVPTRSVPEDFDWQQAYQRDLVDPYMAARRDLDWRPTIAYGDAVNGLRDDLRQGLTEILGTSEGLDGKHADALYAQAQELANSSDAAQAQKARELLETIDAKTYDMIAALASRTEEFSGAARQPLDRHIDETQLLDWLMARQNDATERVATVPLEEKAVAAQEVSYWQQLFLAASEGRNPVAESSEQIAYLRSVGNTGQADAFLRYHDDLLQTVSDPTFHRTAAEMGDNTYAPRAFLWSELGRAAEVTNPPPATGELDGIAAYRTALLQRRAELRDELFALARMVDGDDILAPSPVIDDPGRTSDLRDMIRNLATNVDTVEGTQNALDAIDARARDLATDLAGGAPDIADMDSALRPTANALDAGGGPNPLDVFRSLVPEEMMDDGYLAAIDAYGRGSFSDLTGEPALRTADNALDAGGGPNPLDLFDNLVPDEMMDEGYLAAIDAHGRGSFSDLTGGAGDLADVDFGDYTVRREAINRQAGPRDFARAPLAPPSGLRHFGVAGRRGLGATGSAHPDRDPPAGPGIGAPDPLEDTNRPPGDDFGLARLTRDANVPTAWDRPAITGPARTWDSGARGASPRFGAGRNPSREEAEEGETPAGRPTDGAGAAHWWMGRGRGADPLHLDGALSGVAACGRTRADTPGSAGGVSPFGARGQLVADLMRGQLLPPPTVDALRYTVAEGRPAGRGRNAESANLAALLLALRSGGQAAHGGSLGGTLDWRTLEILLDMLGSSAAM